MSNTKKVLIIGIILIVLLSSMYVLRVQSNNQYIENIMKQDLKSNKINIQSVDVSFNQLKQERTIKVIFKDEPNAIYYYHYDFKTNEAYQLPKYEGSIKKHPENGKYYQYNIGS